MQEVRTSALLLALLVLALLPLPLGGLALCDELLALADDGQSEPLANDEVLAFDGDGLLLGVPSATLGGTTTPTSHTHTHAHTPKREPLLPMIGSAAPVVRGVPVHTWHANGLSPSSATMCTVQPMQLRWYHSSHLSQPTIGFAGSYTCRQMQ